MEELIKYAVSKGQTHLLDMNKIQWKVDEMLQEKVITLHEGKFYINPDHEANDMTLQEFVDRMRDMYSFKRLGIRGKSSAPQILEAKARKFHLETGLKYEQMLDLVDYYINRSGTEAKYLVSARYFFYKQDKYRHIHSKAKDILAEWEAQALEDEQFNDNMDD